MINDKTEKIKPAKYLVWLVWVIITVLQLIRLIYVFEVKKDGFHSDEVWSMGLANSYYEPHIFESDDLVETKHVNEWISGQTFKSYITVDKGQEFSYDSVLYNLKQDAHPPLYFLLVHTICSFFPGKYSPWFTFAINIVVFPIVMFFLFLLGRRFLKSDVAALALCSYYGFSFAGLDTFIFSRQYSLLTMFAVISMYFHVRLLRAVGKKEFTGWLAGIGIVTFLGSLTHYFFLPFAFVISAMFCIGWLIRKNYKKFGLYAAIMFASVAVTVPLSNVGSIVGGNSGQKERTVQLSGVIFTDIFKRIFEVINMIADIAFDVNFSEKISVIINCILLDVFGIDGNLHLPYMPLLIVLIIVLLMVLWCGLSFLITRLPKGNENDIFSGLAKKTCEKIRKINSERFLIITIVTAVFFELYFVSGFADPIFMGEHTDRYFFLCYPAMFLIMAVIIKKLAEKIIFILKKDRGRKIISIVTSMVLVFLCLFNFAKGKCIYLFERSDYAPKFEEMAKNRDVILVISDRFLLTCYANLLYESNDVFVIYAEEDDLGVQISELKQENEKNFYLVVDIDEYRYIYVKTHNIQPEDYGTITREKVEQYYLDFFKEIYDDYNIEFVYEDVIFGRPVCTYKADKK